MEKYKKLLQSKRAAFIIAAFLVIIALVVRLEVVEPLIVLFVIYCSLNFAKKGAIYSTIFAISVLTIQDLYNLHIELSEYIIEFLVIIVAAAYIYKSNSRIEDLNFSLKERVKELAGLYRISEAAEKFAADIDQSLNKIVKEIPASYQYPKDCEARVIYQENEYKTDNFKITNWMQEKELKINDKIVGKIEICYLSKHPKSYQETVFLQEEFELIKSIARKISTILMNLEQEKEIKEQKRFLSITLNSIGDGLIVTDNRGIVERLNIIAENLTGWSKDEAVGKNIRDIFKIVNSKTGELVKNPVEKVLKNGKIEGLANHTKLISKSGEEYHIADSAAPIKAEDGSIHGTVMVFRNITKNYKMRQEIKEREKMFSTAVNEAPFPIMVHAEDGEVININSVWTEITGYQKDEIPTVQSWIKKAYSENKNEVANKIKKSFSQARKKAGEFEVQTKNGEKRIWEFSTAPLGNSKDGRKLVISTAVDITRRKKAEAELKKLNKIYKTLSMVNQLIVRERSLDNLLKEAGKITSDFGNYKNVWIGKLDQNNEKLNIFSSAESNCIFIKNSQSDYIPLDNEVLNLKEDLIENGKNKVVINSCQNLADFNLIEEQCGSRAVFLLKTFGKAWGLFSFCSTQENYFNKRELRLLDELTDDISLGIEKIINEKRRLESEKKLKKSEHKYKRLFQKSPIGIFKTSSKGQVTMINPYMAEILGFDSIEETFKHYNDLEKDLYVDSNRRNEFLKEIKVKRTVNNFVYRAYDKNRNILWLEMNARISKKNNDGTFVIDGFTKNITDRKEIEEKIKYLGFHDKLTGLYNRAFLEEELKRVDTKRQLPISIIMGDLNNLKLINDTYGHQKGDQLIKRAAEIIENACRSEDIIARWGGDEFVILLPKTDIKKSEKIIKRVNDRIEKEEGELAVSISLGTAVKSDKEEEIFAVLSRAEDRMYKNKIANRKSARSSVLSAFLTTLREKSSETEEHVKRMRKIANSFGQKIGLSASEQDRLYLLTQMHDIGKISVSKNILNKPGKLNDKEWEEIKKHTETGFRISSTLEDFAHISHEILYHHERWDGSGYPEGLRENDIPLLARMLTIIDSFDVMISGRPYKKAVTKEEALEELKRCSGSQFDPELVESFIEVI